MILSFLCRNGRSRIRRHDNMRRAFSIPQLRFSESASSVPLSPTTKGLAEGVLRGERISISRAITLIESTRECHRLEAEALLDYVVRFNGIHRHRKRKTKNALRIGIAGPPGAGKSTFIEALGKFLIHKKGMKVAVIAVDPSSSRSGGSILGDKTRMMELARDPHAFVRACPTSGVLGGVARYTNDVVLLCQAASFDVVFIETVGLGQSEIMIDETADLLLLLVPPGGGDELQGVKKGIVEVADVIVVNKADDYLLTAAQHTAGEYKHALHFQRRKWPEWTPTVTLCSALEGTHIPDVWAEIERCKQVLMETGLIAMKRREQGRHWMWTSLEDQLIREARSSQAVQEAADKLEDGLMEGILTPRSAAEILLASFLDEYKQRWRGKEEIEDDKEVVKEES